MGDKISSKPPSRRSTGETYGTKCAKAKSGPATCFKNVVDTCNFKRRDFICLQETDMTLNNAIQKDALRPTAEGGLNVSLKIEEHVYVSILYDSTQWSPVGVKVSGHITDDNKIPHPGRHYQGRLFLHKTIFCVCAIVNMHGPHTMFSRSAIVEQLLTANNGICIRYVFVMGDFNDEKLSTKELKAGSFILAPSNTAKTCCNGGYGDIGAYRKCFDNILGNRGLKYESETWHNSRSWHNSRRLLPHNTLYGFKYANNTSDHSPVATEWDVSV